MCDVAEDISVPLLGQEKPTNDYHNNIGYRLKRRKELLIQRQKLIDAELVLAAVGVIMMLVYIEIDIRKMTSNFVVLISVLKTLTSATTVLLLLAVILYHRDEVKLMMLDRNVDDWRMVVSWCFVFKVSLELLVCAVHPLPESVYVPFWAVDGHRGYVTIDAVLSILMLLRVYILVKFIVMHSKWILSNTMHSIGALNEVDVNTEFYLKCVMQDHPVLLVVSFMFGIFFINSWAMRTCESYYLPDNQQSTFINSMWLVAITFLTVGYGDLSPNTYCGRFIAAETGLMGIGITALLVAVITAAFQQTRAERYVHAFVERAKMEEKRRDAAADVIQTTVKLWFKKQHGVLSSHQRTKYTRKMRRAANKIRELNRKIVTINDSVIGLVDVALEMKNVSNVVQDMNFELSNLINRNETLNTFLQKVEKDLASIEKALNKPTSH